MVRGEHHGGGRQVGAALVGYAQVQCRPRDVRYLEPRGAGAIRARRPGSVGNAEFALRPVPAEVVRGWSHLLGIVKPVHQEDLIDIVEYLGNVEPDQVVVRVTAATAAVLVARSLEGA